MKITWQTRSEVLFDSIGKAELSAKANGGNAYDFQAAMALSSIFNLETDKASVYTKSDNPLSYWWRMSRHLPSGTHRVLEPYPIVFGTGFDKTTNIAMVHHVDANAETGGRKYKWFYNRLFDRIQHFDKVVTVSEYWREYLKAKGCKNVEIIYNSFEPQDYRFTEEELRQFRTVNGFSTDKPLIYIGNAAPGKGVYETYQALKDSDYQLVMTGGSNKAYDLPVAFLSLNSVDYRKLIASCDVVLAMSNMMEGWNRVAHEAMLSKTPVIGSGSGGMRELLQGGKQLITQDFKELPKLVEHCLGNEDSMAESGYAFVSKFDNAYFKNAWRSIIQ